VNDRPIILVIEDDRGLQAIVEETLRDAGFEPAIAGSGEEAVTLLKAKLINYRALITDISLLGRLDGWQVARVAREVDPAFPVIYLTGAFAHQWPSQGVSESVLLKKPFAGAQLITALCNLLGDGSPETAA
jgi:DNA-binding response OmpR family regulator